MIAPALRAHVDALVAAPPRLRRAGRTTCSAAAWRCRRKAAPGFTDTQIRTALVGFIVGGPPQPPMVVPQALEQLLRRPAVLAGAQEAARRGDDALLAGYVFEAMRFDPLAPALPRVAVVDREIAAGTRRATTLPAGTTVLVAFASAMMDGRRVPEPRRFDPRRLRTSTSISATACTPASASISNQAVLPLMLKPLLRRPGLRRAPGPEGRLRKLGAFSDRLVVEFDQDR